MIREGIVRIEKKIILKNSENQAKFQKTIRISQIDCNSRELIGDEIINSGQDIKYMYTATVITENAFLYMIPKTTILKDFPRESITGIRENFNLKHEIRNDYIQFVRNMNV